MLMEVGFKRTHISKGMNVWDSESLTRKYNLSPDQRIGLEKHIRSTAVNIPSLNVRKEEETIYYNMPWFALHCMNADV